VKSCLSDDVRCLIELGCGVKGRNLEFRGGLGRQCTRTGNNPLAEAVAEAVDEDSEKLWMRSLREAVDEESEISAGEDSESRKLL
jgi:hypothetical protein